MSARRLTEHSRSGVVVALVAHRRAGPSTRSASSAAGAAESMVVVLPSADLDEATSASYYETLSRGQIVATFAEVAGALRFEQQAADRLALSAERRNLVKTEVTVVPDTAVILIRSTAGEPQVAQQMSAVTTALPWTTSTGCPSRIAPCRCRPAVEEPWQPGCPGCWFWRRPLAPRWWRAWPCSRPSTTFPLRFAVGPSDRATARPIVSGTTPLHVTVLRPRGDERGSPRRPDRRETSGRCASSWSSSCPAAGYSSSPSSSPQHWPRPATRSPC